MFWNTVCSQNCLSEIQRHWDCAAVPRPTPALHGAPGATDPASLRTERRPSPPGAFPSFLSVLSGSQLLPRLHTGLTQRGALQSHLGAGAWLQDNAGWTDSDCACSAPRSRRLTWPSQARASGLGPPPRPLPQIHTHTHTAPLLGSSVHGHQDGQDGVPPSAGQMEAGNPASSPPTMEWVFKCSVFFIPCHITEHVTLPLLG